MREPTFWEFIIDLFLIIFLSVLLTLILFYLTIDPFVDRTPVRNAISVPDTIIFDNGDGIEVNSI